ncbi:hypothetical protein CERZMDRAFT_92703 [Cercospora zeae-maydis SCOH1-5]|uniref:Uncharacterized protein n=1 Tax=Cercospora zeae-maydis SCOH1-5 TaxID=717836 RepID=A0A6A6FXL5_9PEZI|nr:hypothetical protein CERZMDRAFT_92703 [Cercospora zeae-maydis SCOH1-5]
MDASTASSSPIGFQGRTVLPQRLGLEEAVVGLVPVPKHISKQDSGPHADSSKRGAVVDQFLSFLDACLQLVVVVQLGSLVSW